MRTELKSLPDCYKDPKIAVQILQAQLRILEARIADTAAKLRPGSYSPWDHFMRTALQLDVETYYTVAFDAFEIIRVKLLHNPDQKLLLKKDMKDFRLLRNNLIRHAHTTHSGEGNTLNGFSYGPPEVIVLKDGVRGPDGFADKGYTDNRRKARELFVKYGSPLPDREQFPLQEWLSAWRNPPAVERPLTDADLDGQPE